ncbi:MAG: four helix bundle protein [Parcubacteria group bacterium]
MNKSQTSKQNRIYDLEERTAKFGEDIIQFAKKIPVNEITKRLIPQVVGAGTSIGANYCEADDAESPRDFTHKIGICKKESRESKHFLRMISVAAPELKAEAQVLWQEAKELNLIFNSIFIKVKNKQRNSNYSK